MRFGMIERQPCLAVDGIRQSARDHSIWLTQRYTYTRHLYVWQVICVLRMEGHKYCHHLTVYHRRIPLRLCLDEHLLSTT